MNRSPKQIAADMRSMADMLLSAAQELEAAPEVNQEMIHALQILSPLLNRGGEPVAANRPMTPALPNPTPNLRPTTPAIPAASRR